MTAYDNAEQYKDKDGKTIQVLSPISSEDKDGTSSSVTTSAYTVATVIRVAALGDVRIAVGETPTATSTSMLVIGGSTEYFKVDINQKMAIFGGIANITVMG